MFVVDRIELIFIDKMLKVWEFERDHSVRGQQNFHSLRKVIEIRDLRQHVVTDDQVGPLPPGNQTLREFHSEKFYQRWNVLLARNFGAIASRFYASHGNTQRKEVLKEISIVARNLEHLTLRTEPK